MIYSIIRFVTFVAVIAAMAFGLSWVYNLDGEVLLRLAGQEIRFSIFNALLIIIAILVAFFILYQIVRLGVALIGLLMGDKKSFSRFFARRAQKKGMGALSDTVEAMATGDSKTALKQAYKADKYLNSPVLTGLLLAQSAKSAGKHDEAEAAYKKVLESDKGQGRFAAIRGLMGQRLESGDKETALKLAEKAYDLKSNDLETVNTLFELQVDAKQWDAARKTLKSKAKIEKLPSDFVSRREAVMALCEAKSLNPETDKEKILDRVMLAHRLAPNLVPASIMAAKVKAEDGNIKAADTVLVKAWNAQPHPEIARAYADLQPGETPEARLRRFNVLTRRRKDDPQTRMLKAELLIAAEQFPEARRALGDMETLGETSRSLSILAAIEHGEGADEAIVRAYLARAATASRGPQWVCNNCGHVHLEWVSDCVECELFDTLDWKLPPEAAADNTDSGMGVLMPLLTANQDDTKDQGDIVEAKAL